MFFRVVGSPSFLQAAARSPVLSASLKTSAKPLFWVRIEAVKGLRACAGSKQEQSGVRHSCRVRKGMCTQDCGGGARGDGAGRAVSQAPTATRRVGAEQWQLGRR